MAKTSADAWIIGWYSVNHLASSATSDGVNRSMADSISTTVLMRTNLLRGKAADKAAEGADFGLGAGERTGAIFWLFPPHTYLMG